MFVLKFTPAGSQQMFFAALNFFFMAVKVRLFLMQFMEDPEIQSIMTLKWFF